MLPLILIAVIATDVAVAVMFAMMHRHLSTPAEAGVDEALALEMEAVVGELRAQAEQAVAEIGRQGAQLRRMLTDVESQQIAPSPAAMPVRPAAVVPMPVFTHRDVLRLAAEGHSFRTIAMHTGMSVEEVRLMLAMEEELAA
jgi:hypothetical protein